MNNDFTLGRLVGQTEAFTLIAGRCTAAQAAKMKEIRDSKVYLDYAKDWGEFCPKFFQSGKTNINKFIKLLEDFGPTYFEVAQFTRMSAETYRAIAPAIHDHTLHHNGEAIALIPENAHKVAAAVEEMRPPATPKAPKPEPAVPLEKRCIALVLEIEAAAQSKERNDEVWKAVHYVRERLAQIALTL
jgi:hypothetical protein